MADYDLGTARGRIEIDASGAEKGVSDANKAVGNLGDNNAKAAGALQHTGLLLGGIGAAAFAGFGLAVNASADFEKGISAIGAVSGATSDQLDETRKKALQLGADTKFSAGEAAAAIEELVKSGISVEDALNGAADATVALAAAGEVDLTTAATIAANAMNQFSLSATDMPHIADLIAGAANASAIDVGQFGQSLQQSGAVANLVGLSFDDLTLGIAAMGNAGIVGSDAGTSLKTMLNNLQPATKKQTELASELGIITEDGANQFFDAAGHVKSLADIAGVLKGSLEGLTDAQKTSALETLFGSDAIRAAAVIAQNGSEGFVQLSDAVTKVSATDVAAQRMDNLAGSIEQFKGSVETALISAGAPFQDVIRGIVDGLTKLVNWFGALPEGTQKLIITIALAAAGFLAFAGAVSFIGGTLIKFVDTMKTLKSVLGIGKQIGGLTKAMQALNLTFLANPVFLIIVALVALGVAIFVLYKKSEAFRKFIDGLWQTLQKVWDTILNFFKGLPKFFEDIFGKIGDFFSSLGDKAGAAVGAVIDWFKKLPEEIAKVVQGVIDWVKQNWDILLAIFTGPIGIIILLWRRFGDDILNFAKEFIGGVIDFFASLPERIAFFLGLIIGTAIRWGIELVQWAIKTGVDFVENLISFLIALPGRVLDILTDIIGKVASFVEDMVGKAIDLGTRFVEGMINFIKDLPGKVWDIFTDVVGKVASFAEDLIGRAIDFGKKFFDGVVDFVKDLPGRIGGFFSDMITGLPIVWDQIVSKAGEFGSKLFHGVLDGIGDIAGAVKDLFFKMINGIGDLASMAWDKAKDVAGSIWGGFKKGLGISSPSFIEEAMFTMVENVGKSLDLLGTQVKDVQQLGATLPTSTDVVSTVGMNAIAAAAPLTPTNGMTVQGPLIHIENMNAQDQDITQLSRNLWTLSQRESVAKGQRVIALGS